MASPQPHDAYCFQTSQHMLFVPHQQRSPGYKMEEERSFKGLDNLEEKEDKKAKRRKKKSLGRENKLVSFKKKGKFDSKGGTGVVFFFSFGVYFRGEREEHSWFLRKNTK